MNILLTGINTYLGVNFQSYLLERGYRVTTLVRKTHALKNPPQPQENLTILYGDMIRESYSDNIPHNLHAAYYFSTYSTEQGGVYKNLELLALQNLVKKLRRVHCHHLVYVASLRSPVNKDVALLLAASYIPYTVVRTSNIVGKDSALLEIFKEYSKQFVILSNRHLSKSKAQPIAISDALAYLEFIANHPKTFHKNLDMGGPEILSYREMITQYLEIIGVKKRIVTIPFINDRFSAYLLQTNGNIPKEMARSFQRNIKGDLLCSNDFLHDLFPRKRLTFKEALLASDIEE